MMDMDLIWLITMHDLILQIKTWTSDSKDKHYPPLCWSHVWQITFASVTTVGLQVSDSADSWWCMQTRYDHIQSGHAKILSSPLLHLFACFSSGSCPLSSYVAPSSVGCTTIPITSCKLLSPLYLWCWFNVLTIAYSGFFFFFLIDK